MLRWIYENGGPMPSYICQVAVDNDQLEILEWLRSKGCKWYYAKQSAIDKWPGVFE